MLGEERQLIVLDRVLDVVIVANDEHDVLAEDTQLLLLDEELADLRRYHRQAERHDLLPVSSLADQLMQLGVEVGLEEGTYWQKIMCTSKSVEQGRVDVRRQLVLRVL